MRTPKEFFYPEVQAGGFTFIDGTIQFYLRIGSYVNNDSVVLDIGCGRGAHLNDPCRIRREVRTFKGRCARVIGIDVDSNAAGNPFIDQFFHVKDDKWPINDGEIDVAIADYVIEHIDNPMSFFKECVRVLKPGGVLCFRTPNAYSYPAIATRIIPNRFHSKVTSIAQENRNSVDVFPTRYKCNTKHSIKKILKKTGFSVIVLRHEAEPAYSNFSRIFYYIAVLHQRYTPSVLKSNLFVFAMKNQPSV